MAGKKPLSPSEIERELEPLRRMRDEDIDTSDIPEQRDWAGATRGRYRKMPPRDPITTDKPVLYAARGKWESILKYLAASMIADIILLVFTVPGRFVAGMLAAQLAAVFIMRVNPPEREMKRWDKWWRVL